MISESCSNWTLRRCIFSQIEYGDFSRPDTSSTSTPCSVQTRISSLADFVDHVGTLAAQKVQPGLDGIIGLRIELRETKGLQLGLDRVHADALGQRRVDLHGFAGDALHDVQPAGCGTASACCASRSASLTSSTRMSRLIASTSLPKFSACLVRSDCSSSRVSLVTPSTRPAISAPKRFSSASAVDGGVLDHVVQQRGREAGLVQPVAREDARPRSADG